MGVQNVESERRRFERAAVLWSGELLIGGQAAPCVIVNIAAGGAMVRTPEAAICQSRVTLRNPRLGDLDAEVTWRKNDEMGLRFVDDEDRVAAIIAEALR